ncbi:response regulator transcription factor [Oxalobacteraceae bacterium OM1]|nr:response regulator transcription factor [Oxalobacteraceae bacterium OM1]
MDVTLKIIGTKALFDTITREMQARDSVAGRFFRVHGITCKPTFSSADIGPEDFLCFADLPTIVVLEAQDMGFLNRIAAMKHCISRLMRENPGVPMIMAPVVTVFHEQVLTEAYYDTPDFISDWTFAHASAEELTHRILAALRRFRIKKMHLQKGAVTLIPETRSVTYADDTVRLSPSEFALAELFFSKMGTVISLSELVAFFKATGKSTEANNIRVTIYQLRLKLEALTSSQIKLTTVYRKGYCLKQAVPRLTSVTTARLYAEVPATRIREHATVD